MMWLEPVAFVLLYTSAGVAAWLMTYACHSTLLIAGVWVVTRSAHMSRSTHERLWKCALIGGIVTTSVVMASGITPLAGNYETASFVEARAFGDAPVSLPRSPRVPMPTALQRVEGASGTVALQHFDGRMQKAGTRLRYAPLVVVALWMCYAAAVLMRVLFLTNRARNSLGQRRPVTGAGRVVFDDVARTMGLRRPVQYTTSELLTSPVALGRSEITVPRQLLTEFPDEDQRGVLGHEIAHLVRHDPWWLLAAATIESLFFFQPLNRKARMKWQEQAEYLCDELVVRTQGSGLPLARALARIAEWPSANRPALLAPALVEEPRTLVGRVKVLLSGRAIATRTSRFARAAFVALPLVVMGGSPAFTPGSVRGWGTAAFSWADVMATGQTLEVQGLMGSIRVVPVSSDSGFVTATRHGRTTNPDVHFEVVRRANGVTICAVYPTPSNMPPNECTPGATGGFNSRRNDVEIEFMLRVPNGVHLVASSATGSVTTGALRGNVIATTASGKIEIRTSGRVTAKSGSGDIRVVFDSAAWVGRSDIMSRAGNIHVSIPAAASVDVTAETQTGTVRSDFRLGGEQSFWSRLKPHGSLGTRASKSLGTGGRGLELTTTAGNITLRSN